MTYNGLQWVTMSYNAPQWATTTYNELQWPTMSYMTYNELQWFTMTYIDPQWATMSNNDLQWRAMSYNEWQWVTMTYNELQWPTMSYRATMTYNSSRAQRKCRLISTCQSKKRTNRSIDLFKDKRLRNREKNMCCASVRNSCVTHLINFTCLNMSASFTLDFRTYIKAKKGENSRGLRCKGLNQRRKIVICVLRL